MTAVHRSQIKQLIRFNLAVRRALRLGRYDDAVRASDEALKYVASASTKSANCRLTVETWSDRGDVLEADDRLLDAFVAREKAVQLAKGLVGYPGSKLAIGLARVAQSLRALDRADKAMVYIKQAHQLLEDLAPSRPRDALRARCALMGVESDFLCDSDHMDRAESLKAEALDLWRTLYPSHLYREGHSELAIALTDFGWIAGEKGDDVTMLARYSEALLANELLYSGPDFPNGHPDLANAYNNMGYACAQLGRLIEAEAYYTRAVALREKLYPAGRYPHGRAEMAVSHMNLGEMLLRRGDLSRAQQQYGKAFAMREKLYPPSEFPDGHTDLIRVILALGKVTMERGDASDAVPLYKRAYEMARTLYRATGDVPGRLISAWVKHDFGRALLLQDQDASAERVLLEAKKIYAQSKSLNHLHASTLVGLAEIAARRGQAHKCRDIAESARQMYNSVYPAATYENGHFNLANGLSRLARVMLLIGDVSEARHFVLSSLKIYSGIAERLFLNGSLMDSLLFRAELARLPALLLSIDDWPREIDIFLATFATKSAVRRSQALRSALLFADARPETIHNLNELRRVRHELVRLLYAPFDPAFAEQRRELFAAEIMSKELLERDLANRVTPELDRALANLREPFSLLTKLPPKAVFVDVVRYVKTTKSKKCERFVLQDHDAYCAFVLTREGNVQRVDLGDAQAVDDLTRAWRTAIEAADDERECRAASAQIWEPIRQAIPADTATIFISPDAELHRLPWLALEDLNRNCALEGYEIVIATDPWSSVATGAGVSETTNYLLVGDISFGICHGLPRRPHWEGLLGTRREIEIVSEILGRSAVVSGDVTALDVIGRLSGNRIIHIATHGFYLDKLNCSQFDVDSELVDPYIGHSERERRSARRHSQLLSGLVFGRANHYPAIDDAGVPTENSAILTAEEIISEDLRGTELVVLSACETTLGDTFQGEGVLGLRTAFHQVGAKFVVSSLWPVPDDQTVALMASFYDAMRSQHSSPSEALRKAQLQALTDERRKGRRAIPGSWAGFVISIATWDCEADPS